MNCQIFFLFTIYSESPETYTAIGGLWLLLAMPSVQNSVAAAAISTPKGQLAIHFMTDSRSPEGKPPSNSDLPSFPLAPALGQIFVHWI